MQELEYALKAAFQNADIPLIELTLEPEMIEAAAKYGRQVKSFRKSLALERVSRSLSSCHVFLRA